MKFWVFFNEKTFKFIDDIKDGDIIYIPEKTDYILVAGEVYNQAAILFNTSKTVKDYINEVGGFTTKAAKKDCYISKVNGKVVALRQSKGKFFNTALEPGDAIVIPSKTKTPVNVVQIVGQITDILARVGTSAYILTKI